MLYFIQTKCYTVKFSILNIFLTGCIILYVNSTYCQNTGCPPEIAISENHTSNDEIKATNKILSNKIVEPAITVEYTAGELIELTDSFHVKTNSTFSAQIDEVSCISADPCLVVDHSVETNEFGTHILTYSTPVGDSNGVDYVIVDLIAGIETVKTITWANIQTLRVNTGITENYIVYVNQNDCAPPTDGNNSNAPKCNPDESINYKCGLPSGVSTNCLNNWGFSENDNNCNPANWLNIEKLEEFKNYQPTSSYTGSFRVGMNLSRIEDFGTMITYKNLFKSTRHWSTYDLDNPPEWMGGNPDHFQCNDNLIQLQKIIEHANTSNDHNLARFKELKIQKKN